MPQADEGTELARRLEKSLIEHDMRVQKVASEEVVKGPSVVQIPFALNPRTTFADVQRIEPDVASDIGVSAGVRFHRYVGRPHYFVAEIPRSERAIPHVKDVVFDDQPVDEPNEPGIPYVNIALGIDMRGEPYVVSLDDLPHLLVAGATGSGKSFFLRSILYQITKVYSANEVELVIIDGKGMTDFLAYRHVSHLQDQTKFCRDPKAAPDLLEWLVEHRFSEKRDDICFEASQIYDNTNKTVSSLAELYAEKDHPGVRPMVVIIDEFVEIAMASGEQKKFFELMERFAHHGRALGAHLIAATQRPSVDMVPGVLKGNLARLAFRVQTRADSQVILDHHGAEQLLGQGDMLFKPIGSGLTRLQAFDVQ